MPSPSTCIPAYKSGRFLGELLENFELSESADTEVLIRGRCTVGNIGEVAPAHARLQPNLPRVCKAQNSGLGEMTPVSIG